MTDKIKILLIKKGMTATQLAEKLGMTQPNLSKKMKKDNFTMQELQQIAEVLEVKFEANFILDNEEQI